MASKSSPLISVVTASKNALSGLRETAASVSGQRFKNLEHIVVDAASSDGTSEWLATHPEIRWISEPDDGIADALNRGLRLARGEWVLVLHADDTLVGEDALDRAARALNTTADVVSFDVLFSHDSGERLRKSRGLSFLTNFKTTIPHQGAFCRLSLFERIGSFDTEFAVAMDYEFFLRAYRAGASADVRNRVLAEMPNTGISSKRDWESLQHRFSEERQAHRIHSRTWLHRLMYGIYWPLYLTYRRIRSLASGD